MFDSASVKACALDVRFTTAILTIFSMLSFTAVQADFLEQIQHKAEGRFVRGRR